MEIFDVAAGSLTRVGSVPVGLDPISVRTVADLIVRLRDERGITSVAITHDLLCADIITDKAFFLYQGEIIASGTMDALRRSSHPELRNFFGT